jgi:uncharacterized membrane protein (UPF0127 family)
MALALLNATTNARIAAHVDVARTRRARRDGLLGRCYMDRGTALVLVRTWAVHTAFMKFAIDLIFVDRDGRAIHIVQALRPWRAAISIRAHAVIELPAGALLDGAVRLGERMCVVGADAPHHGRTRTEDAAAGGWLEVQT